MHVADSVLVYRVSNQRGAPRRLNPARIPGIADAGATVRFQSQSFVAARFCARRKVGAQDVGEKDMNPALGSSDTSDGMLPVALGRTQVGDRVALERAGDPLGASATSPRGWRGAYDVAGSSPPFPLAAPGPAPPYFAVHVSSPSSLSIQLPLLDSSFD